MAAAQLSFPTPPCPNALQCSAPPFSPPSHSSLSTLATLQCFFTAAESDINQNGKLHIAQNGRPKQPQQRSAETAATTVAPPQRFGGAITIAAAVSADGIVAETNSHMHAPEPTPWSNVVTNFVLAFATTAEPNDVSDHDLFKTAIAVAEAKFF